MRIQDKHHDRGVQEYKRNKSRGAEEGRTSTTRSTRMQKKQTTKQKQGSLRAMNRH